MDRGCVYPVAFSRGSLRLSEDVKARPAVSTASAGSHGETPPVVMLTLLYPTSELNHLHKLKSIVIRLG